MLSKVSKTTFGKHWYVCLKETSVRFGRHFCIRLHLVLLKIDGDLRVAWVLPMDTCIGHKHVYKALREYVAHNYTSNDALRSNDAQVLKSCKTQPSSCVSVSPCTSARPASRSVMVVGSSTVSSMASSRTVRCPATRPSVAVTIPSTRSSARLVPASTCPALSSSISNQLLSVSYVARQASLMIWVWDYVDCASIVNADGLAV